MPTPKSVASTPHAIVIPDSQIDFSTNTINALMSPPATSRTGNPTSSHKKMTYKNRKRSIISEAKPNDLSQEQDVLSGEEDATVGATQILGPSPSQPKRKREASRGQMVFADAEAKLAKSSPELPSSGVAAGKADPNAPTKSPRKRKSLTRKEQKSNYTDDDDIVTGNESPEGSSRKAVGKFKFGQPKRSKPRPSEAPSTTQNSMPITPESESTSEQVTQASVKPSKSLVYNWPAPVRNVNKPPGQPPSLEDGLSAEPLSSGEDEIPHAPNKVSASPPKTARKIRMKKEGAKTPQVDRKRSISRKSHGDTSLSAAEKALDLVRELNYPPDLKSGGSFTQDEDELIRRAIRDYQDRTGLETSQLVELIHWTPPDSHNSSAVRKRDKTAEEVLDQNESKEFWAELKQINLTRKWPMVKQHVRQQYHNFKSGAWTAEEEEQLKDLAELHPNQWKLISEIIGNRSSIDCYNRFKDYVQHGGARNTNRWSQHEEQLLIRALTTVLQRDEDHRAETRLPSIAVYTNTDINWKQVSVEMGDIRSRLQCSVKWTTMQARDPPVKIQLVYQPGREPNLNKTAEPTPKKRGRPRQSEVAAADADLTQVLTPIPRKRGRLRKSEVAAADFDPQQVVKPTPKKLGRPRKRETATDNQDNQDDQSVAALSKKRSRADTNGESADSDKDSSSAKRCKPAKSEVEATELDKDIAEPLCE
jgi:hypothetical protein